MIQRKPTRWRVDWIGDGSPEAGQLIRHVTPSGTATFARLLRVRIVRNRNPLPADVSCRFVIEVQRLSDQPANEAHAWTLHAYSRTRQRSFGIDPANNRWSPLR